MRFKPGTNMKSDEELTEMVAMYRNGATLSEVAHVYGTNPSTVRRYVLISGESLRSKGDARRRQFPPGLIAALVAEYESGATSSDIARKHGISAEIVRGRLREKGIQLRPRSQGGPLHSCWKGGTKITSDGYRTVWIPPHDPLAVMRQKAGTVLEHRLVMARSLGRPLHSYETVHHKNADKQDNRIDNLQLRQGNHGAGGAWKCLDCGSHDVTCVELD
jgi:transposase-like protein